MGLPTHVSLKDVCGCYTRMLRTALNVIGNNMEPPKGWQNNWCEKIKIT